MKSIVCALLALVSLSCANPSASAIVLASTTSTEDSGLFGELLPAFERAHPQYKIRLVAVGSGEALAIGRRGDADVLLVHSPAAESTFMAQGFGDSRTSVMANQFVLAGSEKDPAQVRGMRDAAAALRRIARARAPFISRGDSSGTHVKELQLWNAAGIAARDAAWYSEVGQGMGETLRMASEREAYTLSDRGSYLALSSGLHLAVLVEGDDGLANPYSVIVVKAGKNSRGARAFAQWILGVEGQRVIGEFGRARFGAPLFTPANLH
jgi:tungstate transport system substrate-binding protein